MAAAPVARTVRALPLLAVVLGLALAVTAARPAAAPPGGLDHDTIWTESLPPQIVTTKTLAFSEGPLVAGWVFLLVAKVHGGSLEANLSYGGQPKHVWEIPDTAALDGDRWVGTLVLPETGSYALSLWNTANATATFWAYYDMSCNCTGKFVPKDIPNGIVIFNNDTEGPRSVHAVFNEPTAMKVRVTAALLAGAGGVWPADFQVLAASDAPVRRQVQGAPPVWLHELDFQVSQRTRVYYFVEGLEFVPANYTGDADLLVSPYYELSPIPSTPFPVALVLAVAAVVMGSVGVALLWKFRRTPEEAPPEKGKGKGPKGGGSRRRDASKGATPRPGAAHGGRRTRRSRGSRRRT